MLAAVEALDRRENTEAASREAEALRCLIEARKSLLFFLSPDSAAAKAMRNFDRTQAQKIRKPKDKTEEAEAIAEEIERLAQDEDFVYASVAAMSGGNDEPKSPEPEPTNEPKTERAKGSTSSSGNAAGRTGAERPGKRATRRPRHEALVRKAVKETAKKRRARTRQEGRHEGERR